MILIVTLNLFTHKTAIVDGLEVNTVNAISDQRMVVGESAIYSALLIKTLQGEPYVLGVAGGIGGRYIKNFLDKNRIKSDLLWKEQESKSELKIIDSVHMTETTFIDDTFLYDGMDLKHLKHKFINNTKDIDTLIVNDYGTVEAMSFVIAQEMIRLGHEYGMKIIASLSGAQLRKAMETGPYGAVLQKMDLVELGIPEEQEDDQMLIRNLRKIEEEYHTKILVYDDDKNIYVVTKHKVCVARYGKFANTLEPMASKDVIVGVLAIGISRKYEIERMTKLMAAAKGAIQTENYPKLCSRKDIDDLYNKIRLVEYIPDGIR